MWFNIEVHTPSPAPILQEVLQSWVLETSHNITELGHQTEALRTLLKHYINSPSSPTDQALNQLVKGCQLAIHSTVILINKNQELRVANQKQWQKRLKTWSYIMTEGSLTDAEGIHCMQITERVEEVILESSFTSV